MKRVSVELKLTKENYTRICKMMDLYKKACSEFDANDYIEVCESLKRKLYKAHKIDERHFGISLNLSIVEFIKFIRMLDYSCHCSAVFENTFLCECIEIQYIVLRNSKIVERRKKK